MFGGLVFEAIAELLFLSFLSLSSFLTLTLFVAALIDNFDKSQPSTRQRMRD